MFNVVIDYLPEQMKWRCEAATSTRPRRFQPLYSGEDFCVSGSGAEGADCEDIVRYAVRLAAATRPGKPQAPDFINQWVSWGRVCGRRKYSGAGAKRGRFFRTRGMFR